MTGVQTCALPILISKEQLEKALAEQRQNGTRVGYNLIKLGFIQELE